MNVAEIVNPLITALKPGDTVQAALDQMEALQVTNLPVVNGQQFLGMVLEQALEIEANGRRKISTLELDQRPATLRYNQHFFDAFRMATELGMPVLAVLDENQHYAGATTLADAAQAFSRSFSVQSRGGMLVLSIYERDYSLAQISRLVEAEGVRLVTMLIEPDEEDPARLRLFLKFNKEDLSRVIATLERFNYVVAEKYHQPEYPDLDKERFDSLMRYLNI